METYSAAELQGIKPSALTSVTYATKVIITNNGTLFVPDAVNVETGDTVMFDRAGNNVGSILNRELNAGEQTGVIGLTGLKPGQYLLRYTSGRENHTQTLVKVN